MSPPSPDREAARRLQEGDEIIDVAWFEVVVFLVVLDVSGAVADAARLTQTRLDRRPKEVVNRAFEGDDGLLQRWGGAVVPGSLAPGALDVR